VLDDFMAKILKIYIKTFQVFFLSWLFFSS
jgi:hypothetical protein